MSCSWGPGKDSKACNSICPRGYITITKNSHIGGQDSGCRSGKYAPLCCTDVQVIGQNDETTCYTEQLGYLLGLGLVSGSSLDPRRLFSFIASEGGSLKAKRHNAVKAKRAGSLEAPLPLNGTTPNNSTLLKRGIHAGSNCLYQMAPDQIGIDIPAVMVQAGDLPKGYVRWSLSASTVSTTTSARSKPTSTIHSETTITTYTTQHRTCDGKEYPQPCMHYSSVALVYGFTNNSYFRPTCQPDDAINANRPMVKSWDAQHKPSWSSYIAKSYINPNGKRVK